MSGAIQRRRCGKRPGLCTVLLGEGQVQRFFREQSHGKLTFEVVQVGGGRRMPKAAGDYVDGKGHFDFERHKAYLADACALYTEVDFSAYPIALVVAAKTGAISQKPGG